jgi:hypothetical protein
MAFVSFKIINFFKTQHEDSYLLNVGKVAPSLRNKAHVSIQGTWHLFNDYEFQQVETLGKLHSFNFIVLILTMP